jgi:hypothetical protein
MGEAVVVVIDAVLELISSWPVARFGFSSQFFRASAVRNRTAA